MNSPALGVRASAFPDLQHPIPCPLPDVSCSKGAFLDYPDGLAQTIPRVEIVPKCPPLVDAC
jgi:hypothetical protein